MILQSELLCVSVATVKWGDVEPHTRWKHESDAPEKEMLKQADSQATA